MQLHHGARCRAALAGPAHETENFDDQRSAFVCFLIRHFAHRSGHRILTAQGLHSTETAHDLGERFTRFDRDLIVRQRCEVATIGANQTLLDRVSIARIPAWQNGNIPKH